MNFGKILEKFWKNGEKHTPFLKIFQKRYIELPILELFLIGAPIKITYFSQVFLIRGGSYRPPVLVLIPDFLYNFWVNTEVWIERRIWIDIFKNFFYLKKMHLYGICLGILFKNFPLEFSKLGLENNGKNPYFKNVKVLN